MSKADSMFEELGYKKYFEIEKAEVDEVKVGYNKKLINGITIHIDFCGDGSVGIINNSDGIYYISIKEIKAINEKCREMNWI